MEVGHVQSCLGPDWPERREQALARIKAHRTSPLCVRVVDERGTPLAGARVELEQLGHEWLLGANLYGFEQGGHPERASLYRQRFAKLLNYATLPFYWRTYEPAPGQLGDERLEQMAQWCREQGILAKGHPLVWHETVPPWLQDEGPALEARLRARVQRIVARYAGLIDVWDVINEATVAHRFQNPVAHWVAGQGPAQAAAAALAWAREASVGAALLVNDYNIAPAYEGMLERLLAAGAPVQAIGLQSHMHKGCWPLARVWQVCETYARFGLPLHFTEVTVLSGPLKTDDEWHRYRTDWHTTPEGEAAQALYVEAFYTLLFSHPAVEAVTWWDLADGGWQGAPAGLLRRDLSPKPAYERLLHLFGEVWRTRATLVSDADGQVRLRGYRGPYAVRVTTPSGQCCEARFQLWRPVAGVKPVTWQITCPVS